MKYEVVLHTSLESPGEIFKNIDDWVLLLITQIQ